MYRKQTDAACPAKEDITEHKLLKPFKPKSDLIDFTLSNARRFYSSKGDPLGVKGLICSKEGLYSKMLKIHCKIRYVSQPIRCKIKA